ncbi:glycosyltransferase family 2 protein [Polymorphobacter fuscus]|uniref:glycosyltransferase family 2 protein n=1 Tax=Sandarakinorhabdus fusca TaxID=1439888 RepID=UPI0012951B65|nr:glycosyltransferase family 2 protein [Polymorphobacter fuscus]NJC08758.1 glycosyltransferase involved in cell wall biosynthesis [Polymorphobacter fuscus]
MGPLVSVVIPAFNAGRYLESAVQSALAQTLTAIEVIIVDDGSTDDTLVVAMRLQAGDARVRVDRLARNAGPAAARNRALELARGRWLAVLDSDDVMIASRLEMLTAAGTRVDADIVADNLLVFGDGQADVFLDRATPPGWITAVDYLRRTAIYGDGPNLGYLKPLIRVDRLRAADIGYDERLRIAEDDDLIVRALLADLRYWFEPTPGYGYRRHAGSTSHRLSLANAEAMLAAGERHEAAGVGRAAEIRAALARRRRAFRKARAFAALVQALKDRRLAAAAGIAVADPAAVVLLHMPIRAARDRFLARFRPDRPRQPPPPAPATAAALAALRPFGVDA